MAAGTGGKSGVHALADSRGRRSAVDAADHRAGRNYEGEVLQPNRVGGLVEPSLVIDIDQSVGYGGLEAS